MGQLKLTAALVADTPVVRIRDDGAGIDLERLRVQALAS
jgi:chemotaxis protein histidine kinase CheA